MSRSPSRIAVAVAAAVALVALLLVVVLRPRGAEPTSTSATAAGTTTTSPAIGPASDPTTTGPDTTATPTGDAAPSTTESGPAPSAAPTASLGPRTTPTTTPLPLNVNVTPAQGAVDGQVVKIAVTPAGGSQIFGYEAFLCRGGVDFLLDADIRPDETGKCISKPLSPNSDDYQLVAAEPPYQTVSSEFRVGVGTDSFPLQNGQTATITCGPGHPCQLVLKLQYPDAYGFRAFPVTYR